MLGDSVDLGRLEAGPVVLIVDGDDGGSPVPGIEFLYVVDGFRVLAEVDYAVADAFRFQCSVGRDALAAGGLAVDDHPVLDHVAHLLACPSSLFIAPKVSSSTLASSCLLSVASAALHVVEGVVQVASAFRAWRLVRRARVAGAERFRRNRDA